MPSCSAFCCTNHSDRKKKFVFVVQNPQKKVVGPLPADKGFYICANNLKKAVLKKI